jgi:hypothetical protein
MRMTEKYCTSDDGKSDIDIQTANETIHILYYTRGPPQTTRIFWLFRSHRSKIVHTSRLDHNYRQCQVFELRQCYHRTDWFLTGSEVLWRHTVPTFCRWFTIIMLNSFRPIDSRQKKLNIDWTDTESKYPVALVSATIFRTPRYLQSIRPTVDWSD